MARRRRRRATPHAPVHRQLPDFSRLPARVPPEEMVTTQEVDPAPDPQGGRDTETEFVLRNAAL